VWEWLVYIVCRCIPLSWSRIFTAVKSQNGSFISQITSVFRMEVYEVRLLEICEQEEDETLGLEELDAVGR
jgi:hypothetical protein